MLGIYIPEYEQAVQRQMHVLLEQTPRWENGAISHRIKSPELWSDSIYMVPPFLAYLACMKRDSSLLIEAARQCTLYREVLRSSSGLWMHIASSGSCDCGLWSTGNGWAAIGMTRVLALLKCCSKNGEEQVTLQTWIATMESSILEILQAATEAERHDGGLLSNYINDRSWFGENAGTAALAAAIFRIASLSSARTTAEMLRWALSCRKTVFDHISKHDGAVSPVVNPLNTQDRKPATSSAEGQAFVLLLEAAHRDWKMLQAAPIHSASAL
jgi:rhamnogalacturonyl hydrolase YesR